MCAVPGIFASSFDSGMASPALPIAAGPRLFFGSKMGYQPIKTLTVPKFEKMLRSPPWKSDLWNCFRLGTTELPPNCCCWKSIRQCLFPPSPFPPCHAYWLHIHSVNHFWCKNLKSLLHFMPCFLQLRGNEAKSIDIITNINQLFLFVLFSTLFLSCPWKVSPSLP